MSALRIAHPGKPTQIIEQRDPYWSLTQRQRQILDTVRGHNGNRSRAARQLGITFRSVQASLCLAQHAGVRVPPAAKGGAGRGPDLRPRKGKPVACGAHMPRYGASCARGMGHAGGHRSLASVVSGRAAQSRYERTTHRHAKSAA